MRIIGGKYGGRPIKVPKNLPVRPTTDFAKEGLFNMLNSRLDFEGLHVLDLFSGTGHMSLEFASRGAGRVVAVDANFRCVGFLRNSAKELGMDIGAAKGDVFQFLESQTSQFDVIFADPPYELPNIPKIHELVFSRKLLKPGGLLIIEHGVKTKLEELEGFVQKRNYGNVNFSFFQQGSAM
jgi:16S rRNA (guanine966-N2)-methyltransferase